VVFGIVYVLLLRCNTGVFEAKHKMSNVLQALAYSSKTLKCVEKNNDTNLLKQKQQIVAETSCHKASMLHNILIQVELRMCYKQLCQRLIVH